MRCYQPPIPFPQRIQKSKLDDQIAKFLNMFKKLEINIPFVDALAQMPHYAKFLKDILSKKRKFDEDGVVNVSATCSALIQKNLPLKMQDLGSFTIPCTIGNYEFGRAVCDSKSKHHSNAIVCGEKTRLGGVNFYNYDYTDGREVYGSA